MDALLCPTFSSMPMTSPHPHYNRHGISFKVPLNDLYTRFASILRNKACMPFFKDEWQFGYPPQAIPSLGNGITTLNSISIVLNVLPSRFLPHVCHEGLDMLDFVFLQVGE